MQGSWAIAVALVPLPTMPFSGDVRGQVQQEHSRPTAFPLKRVDATEAAKKLTVFLGEGSDVAIFSDRETNTVFIRATPNKLQQATEVLARLDVGLPNYLTVIPLEHTDAARIAGTLHAILTLAAFFDGDDREIRVTAAWRGNSLIISASEERMLQAREIVNGLDVKDK